LFHGWGMGTWVVGRSWGGRQKSTEEKSSKEKAACCWSRNKRQKHFFCVSFCVCDHCFGCISPCFVGGGAVAIRGGGYVYSCPARRRTNCLPRRAEEEHFSVCPSHSHSLTTPHHTAAMKKKRRTGGSNSCSGSTSPMTKKRVSSLSHAPRRSRALHSAPNATVLPLLLPLLRRHRKCWWWGQQDGWVG